MTTLSCSYDSLLYMPIVMTALFTCLQLEQHFLHACSYDIPLYIFVDMTVLLTCVLMVTTPFFTCL